MKTKKTRIKPEHQRVLLEHFHVSLTEKKELNKRYEKSKAPSKSHWYRETLLGNKG